LAVLALRRQDFDKMAQSLGQSELYVFTAAN
jgi:hypothetical protein